MARLIVVRSIGMKDKAEGDIVQQVGGLTIRGFECRRDIVI
jgi:hypothetical protein